jgi:YD repeat-containing protein
VPWCQGPRTELTTGNRDNTQGQLVAVTNARRNTTQFQFDNAGRMTQLKDALNGTVNLSNDAAGQLLSVTNARGKVTAFEYNMLGLVTQTTDPLSRSRAASYDLLGRLVSSSGTRSTVCSLPTRRPCSRIARSAAASQPR